MIKMNRNELERELIYHQTMAMAQDMLQKGMVTREEYCEIETHFRNKYLPVSDGLVIENRLMISEDRGNMALERGP